MIPHVVIVKWPRGYVAHIRYDEAPEKSRNISHSSHFVLDQMIDNIIEGNKNESY